MSSITNGARTVPQICIEGKWIGSFTELTELLRKEWELTADKKLSENEWLEENKEK